MITITYDNNRKLEVQIGTSYRAMAEQVQPEYAHRIVLAKVGGKLKELFKIASNDETVHFVTTGERDGMLTYERSMLMLLGKAIHDLSKDREEEQFLVKFSVINGYYVEFRDKHAVTEEYTERLKTRMRELVEKDLPIKKQSVHVDVARQYFREVGMTDKDNLLRFRRSSTVNLYNIGDYVDYFYGFTVPSTGYLKYFNVVPYEAGMALLMPHQKAPELVEPLEPQPKLFAALQDTSNWCEEMGIDTVGEINQKIAAGEIADMILMAEARQEMKIASIATMIAARPSVKCVMIAGPSSSGKTSFSHRLSVQLRGLGLRPHPIEVDNYFVSRDRTPRDENGDFDFESIKAVDTEQFNRDMLGLLAGREVQLPTFNFKQGIQEYKGNSLRLAENDILVIEGIHCLNEELSYRIPAEQKFKIYISALTTVNIDEHNRIPTSDGRLIRRMVRDARTRGYNAEDTIARWASVRHGEHKNIFPYQESADVVFNSSLVYELSVLKSYAEQLLFGIGEDSPSFSEARRLLRFFNYFLATDSTQVPQNSLLKEFIGGSIFNV